MNAQFTRADFPMIGDSDIYLGLDTTGISEGPGGMGLTWNFSTGTNNGGNVTVSWVDPANHPQGTMVPGANIVYSVSNGDYRFYNVDANTATLLGEQSLTGTPCPYTTTADIINFPSSFGATSTDSVVGEYFDGFLTNATRWGSSTTEFDADGTLVTPNATWNNVVRVTTTADYQDSSWTGAAESEILTFRFEWYVPGRRMPVFWTNTRLVSLNGGAYTEQREIWYVDTNAVAIDDHSLEDGMSIYPNPAQDLVRATYVLDAPAQVDVALYDLVGNRVRTVFSGQQDAGGQLVRLQTEDLSAGMYILQITAGERKASRRLTLQ